MKWLGRAIAAVGLTVTACGSSPQIKTTPDYRAQALTGAKVLYVPLAVSSDIGDERTGIILSDKTRSLSGSAACHRTAEAWSGGKVVCFDQQPVSGSRDLADLQLRFAGDQPIPPELWQRLRQLSGAEHVLMFRPESVSSSHEVSQSKRNRPDPAMVLMTGIIVASLVASEEIKTTSASTEIEYTLSASLVDMRTGKLLKVGVHKGGGSRSEGRSLGFAEAPPAVPILESIMVELGEDVLDD
jgi:hypothetical protein